MSSLHCLQVGLRLAVCLFLLFGAPFVFAAFCVGVVVVTGAGSSCKRTGLRRCKLTGGFLFGKLAGGLLFTGEGTGFLGSVLIPFTIPSFGVLGFRLATTPPFGVLGL